MRCSLNFLSLAAFCFCAKHSGATSKEDRESVPRDIGSGEDLHPRRSSRVLKRKLEGSEEPERSVADVRKAEATLAAAAKQARGFTSCLLPLLEAPFLPSSTYSPVASETPVDHADLRSLLEAQLAADAQNPYSAPLMMYDGEILRSERIHVQTAFPISRKSSVLVFNVRSDPPRVIKYQTNCQKPGAVISDILRDFWFQEILKDTGICPRVFFLSPPAKLLEFETPKNAFTMDKTAWKNCLKRPTAHVRYMVMEKVPASLLHLLKQASTPAARFDRGIKLLTDLLPKLKLMHARGIVHADVHPGNLVELPSGDFGLLDFGISFFESEYADKSDIETAVRKSYSHCYFSHYNIQGYRFGFRDDVYKTLLNAAFMMTGTSLLKFCIKHSTKADLMHTFHRSFNIFAIADYANQGLPGLSEDQRKGVSDNLFMALVLSRQVQAVQEQPDYDRILEYVLKARSIAAGVENDYTVDELSSVHPPLPMEASVTSAATGVIFHSHTIPDAFISQCKFPRSVIFGTTTVKFPRKCETEFPYDPTYRCRSFDNRVEYRILTDRELKMRIALSARFDASLETSWSHASCEDRIRFFSTEVHSYQNHERKFFSKILGIYKHFHLLGLTLGDAVSRDSFKWIDSTAVLASLPRTVATYVDPFSGRQVMECNPNILRDFDDCFNRKSDLKHLVTVFAGVDRMDNFLEGFGRYLDSLEIWEAPNYDLWINAIVNDGVVVVS
jgi:serine/threonine protein kinase